MAILMNRIPKNTSTKVEPIYTDQQINNGRNFPKNSTIPQRLMSKTFFKPTVFFFLFFIAYCLFPVASKAQVNAVTFGKNRVQYKKFKWKYYQTKNFNVYF